MPVMCVSSGCLWNLHGEDLFWEGHEITPEGIVHPNNFNLRPGIVQPDVKLETGKWRDAAGLSRLAF